MRIEQYLIQGKDFPKKMEMGMEDFVQKLHLQLFNRLQLREIDEDVIHITMDDGIEYIYDYVGKNVNGLRKR